MNDIELIDELLKRADEEWNKEAREFAIAELEKIREELKDSVYLHRDFVFGVINKHISELKGNDDES